MVRWEGEGDLSSGLEVGVWTGQHGVLAKTSAQKPRRASSLITEGPLARRPCWATSGTPPNLTVPQCLICKMVGIMIISSSWRSCQDSIRAYL